MQFTDISKLITNAIPNPICRYTVLE